MTAIRKCPCGCGDPAPPAGGKRKYAHIGTCRKKVYRERVKREAEAAGLPVSPSLKAIEASTTTQKRPGDAQTRNSGLQVSFRKAVGAVGAWFRDDGLTHEEAEDRAVYILRPALSDRQRALLDARRAA